MVMATVAHRGPGWAKALVALGVLLGGVLGVGGYTFVYARGGSYFTDDPTTCANCHVMQAQYDAWLKSSHRSVATCNDCHAPHDSLAAKLWVKGRNGWNHSLAFTTGRFHEPIMITEHNRRVTESACRYCHQNVVHAIDMTPARGESMSCIRCHHGVGHPP
jgi:cytochrome c nitrite reductase small subunit